MPELSMLEAELKRELYTTDIQKKLDTLSRDLVLLNNIFDFSMTKEDYVYYCGHTGDFRIDNYISFIKNYSSVYDVTPRLAENIKAMDAYRERIRPFYEYSFERDSVFLENIRMQKLPDGRRGAVLITGGFHTDNLCRLLEGEEITYVTVTPKFVNDRGYTSPYYAMLAGQTDQLQTVLRSVIARASTLQVASKLTSLGEAVWGPEEIEAFQAAVMLVTLSAVSDSALDIYDEDNFVVRAGEGRATAEIDVREIPEVLERFGRLTDERVPDALRDMAFSKEALGYAVSDPEMASENVISFLNSSAGGDISSLPVSDIISSIVYLDLPLLSVLRNLRESDPGLFSDEEKRRWMRDLLLSLENSVYLSFRRARVSEKAEEDARAGIRRARRTEPDNSEKIQKLLEEEQAHKEASQNYRKAFIEDQEKVGAFVREFLRPVEFSGADFERAKQRSRRGEASDLYYDEDEYAIVDRFSGGFAEVWIAESRTTGEKLAFKRNLDNRPDSRLALYREYMLLRKMEPLEGVVKARELLVDRQGRDILVEEYAGGNLLGMLRGAGDKRVRDLLMADIVYNVLDTLRRMGDLGIRHYDIKPQNILYDPDTADISIADMGLSRYYAPGLDADRYLSERTEGTFRYVPMAYDGSTHSDKFDLYALGVVMLELMNNSSTGKERERYAAIIKLFNGLKRNEVPSIIRKTDTSPGYTLDKLIAGLLSTDRADDQAIWNVEEAVRRMGAIEDIPRVMMELVKAEGASGLKGLDDKGKAGLIADMLFSAAEGRVEDISISDIYDAAEYLGIGAVDIFYGLEALEGDLYVEGPAREWAESFLLTVTPKKLPEWGRLEDLVEKRAELGREALKTDMEAERKKLADEYRTALSSLRKRFERCVPFQFRVSDEEIEMNSGNISATLPLSIEKDGRVFFSNRIIGRGGYGKVFEMIDSDEGEKFVAKKSTLTGDADAIRVLKEYIMMRRMSGENAVADPVGLASANGGRELYILQQYAGEDLVRFLSELEESLPPRSRAFLGVDIAAGILDDLSKMHEKRLRHNDLSLRNVLYDRASGEVRIGDLGLSRYYPEGMEPEKLYGTEPMPGTPRFIAEDAWRGRHSEKVDLYALGVILLAAVSPSETEELFKEPEVRTLDMERSLEELIEYRDQRISHIRGLGKGRPGSVYTLIADLMTHDRSVETGIWDTPTAMERMRGVRAAAAKGFISSVFRRMGRENELPPEDRSADIFSDEEERMLKEISSSGGDLAGQAAVALIFNSALRSARLEGLGPEAEGIRDKALEAMQDHAAVSGSSSEEKRLMLEDIYQKYLSPLRTVDTENIIDAALEMDSFIDGSSTAAEALEEMAGRLPPEDIVSWAELVSRARELKEKAVRRKQEELLEKIPYTRDMVGRMNKVADVNKKVNDLLSRGTDEQKRKVWAQAERISEMQDSVEREAAEQISSLSAELLSQLPLEAQPLSFFRENDTMVPSEVSLGGRVYRVGQKIGEGGMNLIYSAESPAGDRVALKILRDYPEDVFASDSRERNMAVLKYLREYLISSRIKDVDGVVSPLGAGSFLSDGKEHFFVVQEYAGPSLVSVSESLTPSQRYDFTIEVAEQLLNILSELHGSGVVHRDLKAANLFWRDGKLLVGDFGEAAYLGDEDVGNFPVVRYYLDHIFGPLGYAPTNAIGKGEYSRNTDRYSTGVLLHRILDPSGEELRVNERVMRDLFHNDLNGTLELFKETREADISSLRQEASGDPLRQFIVDLIEKGDDPAYLRDNRWAEEALSEIKNIKDPASRTASVAAASKSPGQPAPGVSVEELKEAIAADGGERVYEYSAMSETVSRSREYTRRLIRKAEDDEGLNSREKTSISSAKEDMPETVRIYAFDFSRNPILSGKGFSSSIEALSYVGDDGALIIALNDLNGRAGAYLSDRTLLAHLIRHEFLEAFQGMPHRFVKKLEMIDNDNNALTVMNRAALEQMSERELDGIEKGHENDPGDRFYEAAQLQKLVRRSKGVLSRIKNGQYLNVILVPLRQDQMFFDGAKYSSLEQKGTRVASKDYGLNTYLVFYSVDADEDTLLSQIRENVDEKLASFDDFLNQDKARIIAFTTQEKFGAVSKALEGYKESGKLTGVVKGDLLSRDREERFSVINLMILGLGLNEWHRLKESGQSTEELSARIRVLLMRIGDYGKGDPVLTEEDAEGLIEQLLSGQILLKIRKIDYDQIREYMEAETAVLRSL
jgi:serine/threonine protein kinase